VARKGKFGQGTPTDYAGNVLKRINEMNATGETAAPAGTTDGTAKSLEKTREMRQQRAENAPMYTDAEIKASPYLSALKRGITYEEALGNYRALTNVLNMSQLASSKISAAQQYKYQQAYNKLTPEQRDAERIFFALGGSLESVNPKYGGYGLGNVAANDLRRLGIDASAIPNYAATKFDVQTPENRIEFKLANPLNATQKDRLQKLRALSKSGTELTAKQVAALNRLKAKKNAPTILP
jgi:hypothetical protein